MHDPVQRATRWRGRLHQAALLVAIPGGVLLVMAARTDRGKWAAAIYASSLIGLYATSSLYNRCLSTPRLRPWMRWIDHAMIYVLIAGSYTPACLLIAPKPWGTITITVIWLAALAGIVVKLSPLRRMRRLGGAWYVLMGWAAILILPVLVPRMTPAMLALLGVGGVLYSAGALVLYQRRPNPHVELFGYHEVWHAFVVVASLCHFAMHWIMVTTPSA